MTKLITDNVRFTVSNLEGYELAESILKSLPNSEKEKDHESSSKKRLVRFIMLEVSVDLVVLVRVYSQLMLYHYYCH